MGQTKERLASRRAAGLCKDCSNPRGAGMLCTACREKARVMGVVRRARRRAAGLCPCGLPPRPGLITCDRCASGKTRWPADPIKSRARERTRTLARKGITPEGFAALYSAQGGACAVCRAGIPDHGQGVHVDHRHSDGVVRGLLCHLCNPLLGFARESAVILQSCMDYLARTGDVR